MIQFKLNHTSRIGWSPNIANPLTASLPYNTHKRKSHSNGGFSFYVNLEGLFTPSSLTHNLFMSSPAFGRFGYSHPQAMPTSCSWARPNKISGLGSNPFEASQPSNARKINKLPSGQLVYFCELGGTRTPNLLVRSQVHYPIMLQVQY